MATSGIHVVACAAIGVAAAACSLSGLTGGGDGGGGAAAAETTGIGPSTTGSVSTSTATTSGAGGDGGGGTGPGGGDGGGGAPPTSDLFAWAEGVGSAYDESTLGTDRRVSVAVAGDVVVVARVLDEDPDPATGARRDRLEIVGLDPVSGERQFLLGFAHAGGDDDDVLQLGEVTPFLSRVVVPLGVKGTLELPGGEAITTNDDDGVVIVVDTEDPGVLAGLVTIGGAGPLIAQSVAVATDGDLLVGGRFSGDLPGCPGGGAALGDNRGFVARIDAATGNCTRAVHFGGMGGAFRRTGVRGLAIDGDLAMAVGGYAGTLPLATQTFTSKGESDAFLVRLDLAGGGLALRSGSARRFGGTEPDLLRDVVSLGGGYFALAGQANAGDVDAYCGGSPLPAGWHALVLRVGPAGNCNWLRALPTDGTGGLWSARSLAVGSDGGLVVGGAFRSLLPCPGVEPWLGVDADGFVLALDPANGRTTHGVRVGTAAEHAVTSVATLGQASEPVIAGSYDQVFDPLLPAPASRDLFTGRLQPMPALPCAP